ncbi:gamma-glutamyltransferase family protein [Nakamurella endophytica]|uniref:Gamma-glutamyltransferase n=1 Tax=Nakamurella endophytica TaxID=1748367 RepID=A0A917WIH0_9ACTN|nr:gamma-glutamyltransferase [Nakamurella endophytica]GGM07415.1 gamma-glutamyltransferase [Nakamurella endophytica]
MATTRPELWGTFGMVASTHYLATAAGMAVLEAGGTAVDAAVAAGFALQVAEPHLNGPGGDLPLLFARPDGPPTVLCGQGVAPAGATVDHYTGLGLQLVPGSGLLAAAVPGSTAAWLTLLRDHGTFELETVLQYAVHLAEGGVPVLPTIARAVQNVEQLFADDWTTSAELYLADGRAPRPGSVLRNPVLAGTYRKLLAAARSGASREARVDAALQAWTQGFVAEAVDAFARREFLDSSGERHAGVLTGADMASWRPTYEDPVTAPFGEWTVAKTRPWGQGPVLLQQLRMLDLLGVPEDVDGAEFVHRVVEVGKLAFADREAWYGDALPVPIEALLSPAYAAERAALIGERADLSLRPGSPDGREPRLASFPEAATAAGIGEPTVARTGDRPPPIDAGTGESADRAGRDGRSPGDTCHVDVVDRWGNTVAAMPSGGWLQSSPVIPALGFPLGTRLQMCALQPGLPTTLTPGTRPRTTLSPSMALRDGRVELAFGSPGGDQQDQWQLNFVLRHLSGGRNLQEAIDSPSFHSTHFPSSFYPRDAHPGQVVLEDRFAPEVLAELERRGHRVQLSGGWTLGRMCAVARDRDSQVLRAGADPRGAQAYAAGR